MFNVLVNIGFEDRHTGKKYTPGDVIQLTEERIAEVQEVNKDFITVLGEVEPPKPKKKSTTKVKGE